MTARLLPTSVGWWWCSVSGSQKQPVWVFETSRSGLLWARVEWVGQGILRVDSAVFAWAHPVLTASPEQVAEMAAAEARAGYAVGLAGLPMETLQETEGRVVAFLVNTGGVSGDVALAAATTNTARRAS